MIVMKHLKILKMWCIDFNAMIRTLIPGATIISLCCNTHCLNRGVTNSKEHIHRNRSNRITE